MTSPLPDPAMTVAATQVARAIRWVAAKLKVEPVAMAGALRWLVGAAAMVLGATLGVTVSPVLVAGALAVLAAAEALLSKAVRSRVTPNDRVVVGAAELEAVDADMAL